MKIWIHVLCDYKPTLCQPTDRVLRFHVFDFQKFYFIYQQTVYIAAPGDTVRNEAYHSDQHRLLQNYLNCKIPKHFIFVSPGWAS